MPEIKKVILTSKQWGTIFENVLGRGKTLGSEAERIGMSEADLIKKGDTKYSRNPKMWEKCKRTSSKRG